MRDTRWHVGDLVFVFDYDNHNGLQKKLALVIEANWPPPGQLQIDRYLVLVDGITKRIDFQEMRAVSDFDDDGRQDAHDCV